MLFNIFEMTMLNCKREGKTQFSVKAATCYPGLALSANPSFPVLSANAISCFLRALQREIASSCGVPSLRANWQAARSFWEEQDYRVRNGILSEKEVWELNEDDRYSVPFPKRRQSLRFCNG